MCDFDSTNVVEILKGLKTNRVTIDICANDMNELQVLKHDKETNGHHVIFDTMFVDTFKEFKKMSNTTPQRQYSQPSHKSHQSNAQHQPNPIQQNYPNTQMHHQSSYPIKSYAKQPDSFNTTHTTHTSHIEKRGNLTKSQSVLRLNDPLMFAMANYVDKTLSLFSIEEINKKVAVFKTELKTNLDNHHQAYKKLTLKTTKKTIDEIRSLIDNADRKEYEPLLVYFGRLLKKNVCFRLDDTVCSVKVSDDNMYLNITECKDEKQGMKQWIQVDECHGFDTALDTIVKSKVERYKNIQNLKKILVKDLKIIAEDLGIELFKVVDGKKISLLKEELVDKISELVHTSI
jgi:hypothetical protein